MRYFNDGPDIPAHLLEQQALGNVIFFCGAGVSMPAGLDSFWELTDRIVTSLDAQEARKLLDDGWDFDRIFNQLVKEFERPEIDRQIYKALGRKRAKTLAHHRAILSLSKGAAGTTQLVTTNFDLLFERAGCKAPKIVPPNLPNLELNQAIDGVVYLHGRLADPDETNSANYVVSSSDFGRAYLAEGWAARFVKELRERYTLVFLGYSADDPPMRYLLEGLNDREGVVYDNPIYAFSAETNESAIEAWYDRGVTPVGYDPSKSHSKLWETIHAWAAASNDPQAWTESVIELARRGPRKLLAFERGQVVELISTKKGATAFADAKPAITSEWLCVFDPITRYGKPRKRSWGEDDKEIDPQQIYGLDSDQPRPPQSSNRLFADDVQNPLAWRNGDGDQSSYLTLQGSFQVYRYPLPPRLYSIARWFGVVSHEPSAIWWASGWHYLNQHLLWFVAQRLRDRHGERLPDEAAHFWSFYLERTERQAFDDQEYRWFDFEGLVRNVGWNGHTLRYLERCIHPTVAASRPSLSFPCPPEGDWADIDYRDVTDLNVRVLDRHGHNLDIPADILPVLVRMLRVSLVRMVELLDEVGNTFWRSPNFHPSGKPDEHYHGKKEQFVLWFSQLFGTLATQNRTLAREEWDHWPVGDERLFDKLRVWAASLPGLHTDREVHELLLSLGDQSFWSSDDQRGILLLIKQRWQDFSERMRRSLERRIESGPPRWGYQSKDEYKLRKASHAASRLRWLELSKCELSNAAKKSLNRLKKVDDRWTDKWAEGADDSLGPRGGMIAEVTEAQGLEQFSVTEILEEASRLTKEDFDELRHYKPFRGLVEEYPFKALSALRRGLKDANFPIRNWIDLLSVWPKRTKLRLRLLLAHTIASLTDEQALELRYYSADWLQSNLAVLYRVRPTEALSIFDGFLRPFLNAAPTFTKSSIGETTIAGEVQVTSEVSNGKAINSPIGKLSEALWRLTPKRPEKRGRPDPEIAARFERLAQVPGDGSGHAIVVLTKRLGWIIYCFEDWAHDVILPMFKLDHPLAEAAWHGFIYNQNALSREAWSQLRSPFLEVIQGKVSFPFEREARRSLIQAIVWLADPNLEGGPIFTFPEMRTVLKELDDQDRGQVVWALGNVLKTKNDWASYVKPFIEQVWPREKRFRSEETTRGFLRIAENSGENFADVVRTVKSLLRPVPHADTFTYRLSRENDAEESNAKQHPMEAIQLLDAITGDDRVTVPFGFADALSVLGETDPRVRETPEFRRLIALVE